MAEEVVYNQVQQPKAFQGASTSYKNDRKGLLDGKPDDLVAMEIANLQMRSQDQIRNNGYAKIARAKYVTNLGSIVVNWKHTVDGKVQKHELMQELWDEFVANPNLDGYGTLANTQSLWHSEQFVNGSAFTRQLIVKTGNSNRIPLKLQVIPSTMHDIFYSGKADEKNTTHGIKFKNGKPETYYFREDLYKTLWGTDNQIISNFEPKAIPAKELTHQFNREYAGQWIGIPALASVLIPLYEVDELIEATVAKQKAAQAIAWIIENTGIVGTPTGSATLAKDENNDDKIVFKGQGGATQYMNKGEKIHFYQSTDIGANLPILIQSELRRIALSVGVPYHSLTGDLSGIDFSSLRAIGVELRQNLEYLNNFYTIPLSLNPIAKRAKELASLRFDVEEAYPTFRLPIWRGFDDLKDIQADNLELNSGLGAIQKILGERDLTMEDVMESAANIKLIEEAMGRPLAGANVTQVSNTEANSNSSSN